MAQSLSDRLGQQFVVENRPGAGSNIGTEMVVRAAPDGYTLLLVVPSSVINATLYPNLNYNFIRDVAPVGSIGDSTFGRRNTPRWSAPTVGAGAISPLRAKTLDTALVPSSGSGVIRQYWQLFQRSQRVAFSCGMNRVRACPFHMHAIPTWRIRVKGCCVDRLSPPARRRHSPGRSEHPELGHRIRN